MLLYEVFLVYLVCCFAQVYLPQSSAKPMARSSAMTRAEGSFKLARIMIGTVG